MVDVGVPVENQALGHRERHYGDRSRRIEVVCDTGLVWRQSARQLGVRQLTVLRHSLAAYALGSAAAAP